VEPIKLCRMTVAVNGKQATERALNDVLFCHDCPASTTRYVIEHRGDKEAQTSSGIWVATAAGSTAAIRAAGGRTMGAGSKRLQFAVREPYPWGPDRRHNHPSLTAGFVDDGDSLVVRSKTDTARLYVDGPHVVIPVSFGDAITFTRSRQSLRLYGYKTKNSDR
jgi:NAD+ kinase